MPMVGRIAAGVFLRIRLPAIDAHAGQLSLERPLGGDQLAQLERIDLAGPRGRAEGMERFASTHIDVLVVEEDNNFPCHVGNRSVCAGKNNPRQSEPEGPDGGEQCSGP